MAAVWTALLMLVLGSPSQLKRQNTHYKKVPHRHTAFRLTVTSTKKLHLNTNQKYREAKKSLGPRELLCSKLTQSEILLESRREFIT